MQLNYILINARKCDRIKNITEEDTKNYLVLPFIKYLGYDIHDPNDLRYEFICDMHENGSRRVDCAIVDDLGKPLIIIEIKATGKNLSLHVGQVKSYLVSSGAKYAILTNGIEYYLFCSSQIDSDFYLKDKYYSFNILELSMNDYNTIRELEKSIIKPQITEITTAITEETARDITGMNEFCKNKNTYDVVGRTTHELYNEYLKFCIDNEIFPISLIAWSKKMNKIFNTKVIAKRINGDIKRVFV